MGAPEPLSPRESADLLKALEGAPAPHGMARRAVAIWADEAARDAGQSAPRRALGWWAAPGFRSAFAVAATVALVLFVRGRIGVNDAPMIGDATPPPSVPLVREREKTDRSVAPPAPILQAPGGVKGSAGPTQAKPAGKRSTAKMASPSSPVVGEAERAAHAPMAEQDMLVGVPRQIVGSQADMTYLNGGSVDDAEARNDVGVADPRLLRRVSLAEDGADMPDFVGTIRELTGVEISLSEGAARMPLAVHCDDKPLGEVLRQMGRALDIRWERVGAGESSRYVASAARSRVAMAAGRFAGADAAVAPPAPAGKAESSRSMGGAARVSVIGDPDRVRQVLSGGNGAATIEGWLIAR